MDVIVLDAHREGDVRIGRHIKYLADQGLNVYRIHINYRCDSVKPGVFFQYGVKGFRINILTFHGKVRTLYFLSYCLSRKGMTECLKALDELDFDPTLPSVIHVHDPELLPLAGMLVKKNLPKSKIVYDRHEVYEEWIQYLGTSIPVFFENRAKKYISGTVVVSEHHIGTVSGLFPSSRVVAVQNYPLSATYDPEVINEKINSSGSDSQINAVYFGSLNNLADRDVDLLLDIADTAIQSYDNVNFIIGGGSLDAHSKVRIDELCKNRDGRFQFLGFIPQERTIELTQKAHIGFLLVKPNARYWVRTSPNKVFEYLICGTAPIIRADVDHADVLKGCSLLFSRSDDNKVIMKAVMDLLGSPERLKEYMENARELSVNYTWESVACRYIELYRVLLHPESVSIPLSQELPG